MEKAAEDAVNEVDGEMAAEAGSGDDPEYHIKLSDNPIN